MERSISSSMKLLAPRKMIDDCVCFAPPLMIRRPQPPVGKRSVVTP